MSNLNPTGKARWMATAIFHGLESIQKSEEELGASVALRATDRAAPGSASLRSAQSGGLPLRIPCARRGSLDVVPEPECYCQVERSQTGLEGMRPARSRLGLHGDLRRGEKLRSFSGEPLAYGPQPDAAGPAGKVSRRDTGGTVASPRLATATASRLPPPASRLPPPASRLPRRETAAGPVGRPGRRRRLSPPCAGTRRAGR